MSLRILVVEDDREIRAMMQSSLSVEGFEVQTAVSLSEARAMLKHAVLKHHALPILVVPARHQAAQKIQLLDAGADDYLSKPFSVSELLARIRVALRHRGTALDDLKVDLALRVVQSKGGTLHLTPTEFNLLARLVRSAGRVVTHRQLLTETGVGYRLAVT